MGRKNSSGVTALNILRNASSRDHFEALQNSSRLLTRLGAKGKRLGVGTTRNEQLHKELKFWMSNIYQSHKNSLESRLQISMFAKLLTHTSAAYTPTLTQKSQQQLLAFLAGKLRVMKFFPENPNHRVKKQFSLVYGNKMIQKSPVEVNITSKNNRKKIREESKSNWKKKENKSRIPQKRFTNIFKRRRKK